VSSPNVFYQTGGEDGTARLATVIKKKERVLGTLKHRREGSLNGHVVEAVGFNDVFTNSTNQVQLVFTAGSAGLLVVWDQNTLEPRYGIYDTWWWYSLCNFVLLCVTLCDFVQLSVPTII